MNREEARECAAIMLAYADGAEIESRNLSGGNWIPGSSPHFDFDGCEYRVKSNAPDQVWLNIPNNKNDCQLFLTKIDAEKYANKDTTVVEYIKK